MGKLTQAPLKYSDVDFRNLFSLCRKLSPFMKLLSFFSRSVSTIRHRYHNASNKLSKQPSTTHKLKFVDIAGFQRRATPKYYKPAFVNIVLGLCQRLNHILQASKSLEASPTSPTSRKDRFTKVPKSVPRSQPMMPMLGVILRTKPTLSSSNACTPIWIPSHHPSSLALVAYGDTQEASILEKHPRLGGAECERKAVRNELEEKEGIKKHRRTRRSKRGGRRGNKNRQGERNCLPVESQTGDDNHEGGGHDSQAASVKSLAVGVVPVAIGDGRDLHDEGDQVRKVRRRRGRRGRDRVRQRSLMPGADRSDNSGCETRTREVGVSNAMQLEPEPEPGCRYLAG